MWRRLLFLKKSRSLFKKISIPHVKVFFLDFSGKVRHPYWYYVLTFFEVFGMKKLISLLSVGALSTALPLMAEGAEPARQGGNMIQTIIMIGVAVVFFYFILWRPEQKRRKKMEQVRSSLKKGDRVTAMGLIGTVVKVQENSVILAMHDGAKVEMLKAAITDVQPAAEEKAEKPIEVQDSR